MEQLEYQASLEYVLKNHQYSIYTPSNGLFRNHNILKGFYFNNISTPMFDYLLNFCKEHEGDFSHTLFSNSGDSSATYCKSNHALREDETAIKLPVPKPLRYSLKQALVLRNSHINFQNKKLRLKILSSLLYHATGITLSKNIFIEISKGYPIQSSVFSRPYGSGGALYPINIYIYINKIDHLDQGFYLYQPVSHTIRKINDQEYEITQLLVLNESTESMRKGLSNIGAAIFFGYDTSINYLKYGELSLGLAYIDIGALVQNLNLVSTAYNTGFCAWGGIKKTNIERALKLDGVKEHILMAAIIGVNK